MRVKGIGIAADAYKCEVLVYQRNLHSGIFARLVFREFKDEDCEPPPHQPHPTYKPSTNSAGQRKTFRNYLQAVLASTFFQKNSKEEERI